MSNTRALRPAVFAFLLGLITLGQTPIAAQGMPEPEFNDSIHQMLSETDVTERDRLLGNTPQWVVQLLRWPPTGEIEAHLGVRDEEQVAQATDMIHRIIRPDYLPDTIAQQWIPLRDWNVFYTDWIDHGGADAFLTNYSFDRIRIQIADTPNFVILAVRPTLPRPAETQADDWVVQVVEALCTEDIQPIDPDDPQRFRLIEIHEPDEIVEGDWLPQGPEGRRNRPSTSASVDIERVKFFTNSQFVVISVPKFLWDPTSLVNPFADRFPIPSGPAEIAAISQMLFRTSGDTPAPREYNPAVMNQLLEELLRATPSPILLRDWGRRMGGLDLNMDGLQALFGELSDEQRGLWHTQQLAQRVMAEGVQALAEDRYEEAAIRFMHVLILDPLNVSGAMLLEITRDRARSWAVEIEQPLPLPWFEAANEALQRHRDSVEERRIQNAERTQRNLALRDLRTQWIEAYSEGDLRRARQILHRMLDIDPGNASSLFFVDLIERLLAAEESTDQ